MTITKAYFPFAEAGPQGGFLDTVNNIELQPIGGTINAGAGFQGDGYWTQNNSDADLTDLPYFRSTDTFYRDLLDPNQLKEDKGVLLLFWTQNSDAPGGQETLLDWGNKDTGDSFRIQWKGSGDLDFIWTRDGVTVSKASLDFSGGENSFGQDESIVVAIDMTRTDGLWNDSIGVYTSTMFNRVLSLNKEYGDGVTTGTPNYSGLRTGVNGYQQIAVENYPVPDYSGANSDNGLCLFGLGTFASGSNPPSAGTRWGGQGATTNKIKNFGIIRATGSDAINYPDWIEQYVQTKEYPNTSGEIIMTITTYGNQADISGLSKGAGVSGVALSHRPKASAGDTSITVVMVPANEQYYIRAIRTYVFPNLENNPAHIRLGAYASDSLGNPINATPLVYTTPADLITGNENAVLYPLDTGEIDIALPVEVTDKYYVPFVGMGLTSNNEAGGFYTDVVGTDARADTNLPSGPEFNANFEDDTGSNRDIIIEWDIASEAIPTGSPTLTTPYSDQSNLITSTANIDLTTNYVNASTFTVTGLPAGLSSANGVVTGTVTAPAGVYTVTVVATNGSLGDTPQTFTWYALTAGSGSTTINSLINSSIN
jgi:hypothetical protein